MAITALTRAVAGFARLRMTTAGAHTFRAPLAAQRCYRFVRLRDLLPYLHLTFLYAPPFV